METEYPRHVAFPDRPTNSRLHWNQLQSKKMTSGDLQIQVENRKRSHKIRKLELIEEHQVSVTAHRSLNNSRGVMSYYELIKSTDAEIEEALADRRVLAARTIIIRCHNKEVMTKNVVLTFARQHFQQQSMLLTYTFVSGPTCPILADASGATGTYTCRSHAAGTRLS